MLIPTVYNLMGFAVVEIFRLRPIERSKNKGKKVNGRGRVSGRVGAGSEQASLGQGWGRVGPWAGSVVFLASHL